MFKRLFVITLLLLPMSVLAQPRVVTTIKPLQLIAAAVTDGVLEPEVLIPSNQSYHHFNLRPSSVRSLTSADLILWVGPELEIYLADTLYQLRGRSRIVAAASLADITRHAPGDADALLQSEDPHAGHHHGFDPHLWLDTGNARLIARQLSVELTQLDPDNAQRYTENLALFESRLQDFDEATRDTLADFVDRDYAVYHNAFQYFERQHGLRPQLVFVADDEMQPGMRQLLTVRNTLQSMNLACVLEDATANAATIQTVLGSQDLRRVRADTLGDQMAADGMGYVNMMQALLDAYRQCFDG